MNGNLGVKSTTEFSSVDGTAYRGGAVGWKSREGLRWVGGCSAGEQSQTDAQEEVAGAEQGESPGEFFRAVGNGGVHGIFPSSVRYKR